MPRRARGHHLAVGSDRSSPLPGQSSLSLTWYADSCFPPCCCTTDLYHSPAFLRPLCCGPHPLDPDALVARWVLPLPVALPHVRARSDGRIKNVRTTASSDASMTCRKTPSLTCVAFFSSQCDLPRRLQAPPLPLSPPPPLRLLLLQPFLPLSLLSSFFPHQRYPPRSPIPNPPLLRTRHTQAQALLCDARPKMVDRQGPGARDGGATRGARGGGGEGTGV